MFPVEKARDLKVRAFNHHLGNIQEGVITGASTGYSEVVYDVTGVEKELVVKLLEHLNELGYMAAKQSAHLSGLHNSYITVSGW